MRVCSSEGRLPIPPALVFDAWTIGWELWCAEPASVRATPRVGAPFCFDVIAPVDADGHAARHPHYGRFLELSPPSRVAFTWVTGPEGTGGAETTVRITLTDDNSGGTHCALVHSGFATDEACERHAAAWPQILRRQTERLARVTAAEWAQLHARLGGIPDNRSLPEAAFIPTRSYPDMDAAVRWLVHVLGCRERLRVPGHRVQLTLGNGAMVVAAWDPASAPANSGRPPATLLVRVADTDAAWARALAGGAEGVSGPTTYPYGERQATVRDPAGHAWTLSQTVRDVDPVEWGGEPAP
jgi:uncharacterized glyoxalase superfamily protein PhnB/uncharacterized protein YndB with AHSA1/START domain